MIRIMILVSLLFLADSAAAQDGFKVERSSVAAPYGQTQDVAISLTPLTRGPGKVFSRRLTHAGAQTLRVHFRADAAAAGSTWTVKVLDGQGQVRWTAPGDHPRASDFWSGEIAGDTVTLEVHSTVPEETVKITVDRYLAGSAPARQEAISGPDQRAPIGTQTAQIRGWGRSVARIRFVADNGRSYFCTGFLVASDLLLTNEHCMQTESEWRSALIDFDYDSASSPLRPLLLSSMVLLDHDLDYGLFQLASSPDRNPLRLRDAPVADGQALLIIQHPAGEPKQVSLTQCVVRQTSLAGRGNAATDFGHLCDTIGGSSGSPVQHPTDGTVLGLHHLGFVPGSATPVNQAVHIGRILADIKARKPDAYRRIAPSPDAAGERRPEP